jgi:hypothetical protein
MTVPSPAPGALPNSDSSIGSSVVTKRVRKNRAMVYANVGVDAEVEIKLEVEDDDRMHIEFGGTGPDLILDIADLETMERLAEVAAEGVRLWLEDSAAVARFAAERAEAARLMGASR